MTLEIKAGIVLGVLIALALFFAYRSFQVIVAHFKFKKAYNTSPRILPAEGVCKGPHNYSDLKVFLAMRGLVPKEYTVCQDCGFIVGTDKKLSKEGLLVMKETQEKKLKVKAEIDKLKNEVKNRLEFARDAFIGKYSLTLSDATKISNYHEFILAKNEEIIEKVNAEYSARQELESKYASWTK